MRNGITHTILERERLTLDATTLPQVLGKAGYKSGIFGKWHLGDEDAYQPRKRGFDEAFIHGAGGIGQAYQCSCADAPQNSYFDPIIRHNESFVQTKGFCTDVFFDAAIGWIEQQSKTGQPFFAYIATNAPHSPYFAPEKNIQRFKALGFEDKPAGYYGMIENIDENMGRLVTALERNQLMSKTLLIFMSDNGSAGDGLGRLAMPLGNDNGKPILPFNDSMRGTKGSPEEGGVRVPFFVRMDGKLIPNRTISNVVAHLDVFPTLVDLAGGELPINQVEGRSMLPLWIDPTAKWEDRMLVTHCGRWPTGAEPNDFQFKSFALRNARFRLVNNTELFDMLADPGQTKNVIDQHPDVVKEMRAAYEAWWKQTRPMMVNESAPMSPTRPYHEWFAQQKASTGIPDWRGYSNQ
jgi:arylsulfatase